MSNQLRSIIIASIIFVVVITCIHLFILNYGIIASILWAIGITVLCEPVILLAVAVLEED